MAYDQPTYIVRQEHCAGETTAGSGTANAKFMQFQKYKLKAVHFYVTAAGTSASPGHSLTVRKISGGTATTTTSIGLVAVGTAALGALVTGTVNADIAAGDQIVLINGTDLTGKGIATYEYQTLPDAVQTA